MRSPVRRRGSPLNTLLSLRSLLIQTPSQRNGVQFISDWTDTADNPGTSISNCQLKTNYLLSRILSFTDYLLLKLNAIWLLRVFCLSDSTGLCKKRWGKYLVCLKSWEQSAQALLPHPALEEKLGLFLICLPPHCIVNFTVNKKDKT